MNTHCVGCEHAGKADDEQPCAKCLDSFCGAKFPKPSHHENNGKEKVAKKIICKGCRSELKVEEGEMLLVAPCNTCLNLEFSTGFSAGEDRSRDGLSRDDA